MCGFSADLCGSVFYQRIKKDDQGADQQESKVDFV
jgi:hypothetical protein